MSQTRQTPQSPPAPTNESPLTRAEEELLAAALPANQLAEGVPDHVDVMEYIDAVMLKENPPEPQSSRVTRLREVLGV